MLRKNLFVAIRSLRKDLSYTISNVVGLSIGITCCLLILSYVRYEMSFDSFHKKSDHIYRLDYDVLRGGAESVSPSVPVFVAPALKDRFPEIEAVTRFVPEWVPRTIRHGNTLFDENGFCYADPNFFKVFDFKRVAGYLASALDKPNTLVITEAIARKYFGNTDPIGQTLWFNNKKQFSVAAVIQNVPGNSHFTFDLLTSLYSNPGFDSVEKKEIWNNPNYSTYLVVKPNTDVAALYKKIDAWVNPKPADKKTASLNSTHLRLEALKDVHFNTEAINYKSYFAVTDFKYVRIFITTAILILLIACANYINLSTAKASVRAKEVGIRKTIGASLWQLFAQFIAESFLLTLVSVAISLLAVKSLLPYLNDLLGKQIPFNLLDGSFLPWLAGGTILISLLAGFYPALVLSRFRPVETLKGDHTRIGASGVPVRKGLVVLQFTISVALILGTLVVRRQLDFMQSTKLGFDKDHVLIISGNSDIYSRLDAVAAGLGSVSGVQDAALTWRSPFLTVVGNGFSIKENPTSEEDWSVVGGMAGDQHYLHTLGITLMAGRNFGPARVRKDSGVTEFIVNEAFLRQYRLKPGEAIGKKVILGIAGPGSIVGVVRDFHISSMHDKIQPIVLFNQPDWFGSILLRIGPGNLSPVLAKLQQVWRASVPARPFTYSFLDEEYDSLYRTEQRLGTLMSLFCGTAILVTCLGLLGLMAFTVAQRRKEIGIRKVLGASVMSITTLLSTDLLRLMAIAMAIACPVAWYFMHHWLQDFAYRVGINWWLPAAACGVTVFIALATISFQAIKAAVANPVKSLRSE